LSNLGYVSNLEVMEDGNRNLPEVPNETLLIYPNDTTRRPYNCYLVDNLHGSNVPALAIPRPLNVENFDPQNEQDWVYFQPADNFLSIDPQLFDVNVKDYQFVYWEPSENKYKKAEGKYFDDPSGNNAKMPMGIRIGNNIIYSGEVTNFQSTYQYTVDIYNRGLRYAAFNELNIIAAPNLIFKVKITNVNSDTGEIQSFELIGPSIGNVKIENGYIATSQYDKSSPFPREGNGARFIITCVERQTNNWNFGADWLNKPVYCDKGDAAGNPTLTVTDSFLGWVTSTNSIRLGLDLRNEATTSRFGTTRYATSTEVKDVAIYQTPASGSAVTPQGLNDNYIQKTLPTNSSQPGATWSNPINVDTCIHFRKTIVGSHCNPTNITDEKVDFWGRAYRAEWADLAEYYEADQNYEPGTLITFGAGDKEITKAQFEADGVISSKPGLQLGVKKSDCHLPVALAGRVPVMMDGNSINYFGDKIYLSRIKPGTASTIKNGRCIGKIIDKNPGTKRLLECVVRIDFDND